MDGSLDRDVGLFGEHGDDSAACLSADGTVKVVNVLPIHESGVPSIVGEVVPDGLIERSRIHHSTVRVLSDGWLP